MKMSLGRRAVAEFLGTAFLVAAVIGSGVMGDRLANCNIALALLANTVDVPWFVIAQFLGGIAATMVFRWLVPTHVRTKEVLLRDLEQNC
jgi:glycerol uptake facilitator-like aquaporin